MGGISVAEDVVMVPVTECKVVGYEPKVIEKHQENQGVIVDYENDYESMIEQFSSGTDFARLTVPEGSTLIIPPRDVWTDDPMSEVPIGGGWLMLLTGLVGMCIWWATKGN